MGLIGSRTIKTGIGAFIAIWISQLLGLEYSAASGIIVLLTLQSTRKKSMDISYQRVTSAVVALLLATLLFNILGFNSLVFGLFLIIFIPLSVEMKVDAGIASGAVLVTHLLVKGEVTWPLFINECLLVVIGVGIALLMNIYIPSKEKELKESISIIEEDMKIILNNMASFIESHDEKYLHSKHFGELKAKISEATKLSYENIENKFCENGIYYVAYMEMRRTQFQIIKRMRTYIIGLFMIYEHGNILANFSKKVSDNLFTENTAEGLIDELKIIREQFKVMELPKTREEFENRAILFQYLNDLESFLRVKYDFSQKANNKYYN
ncbi:Uncharacterized membrane protein YgaE, UPF0421/DUF939 family [Clostridium collagenovorans DSM 3089]|uniref:Uncharacterized membrane protein YgaE, UPF0421/DUF939 family n=1 Tax=Clostridium collagenovorans DSM 3089 TaxID=1121306 RepID=A0A1M5X523_9CLOT|nr:aromatic acid exporter family protein [Clostridium collagenovorans]SHH94608.1 Uncharacterized membrane protein YgaE, UPF0421/DUF939 family [Clostridium collagenovorans DSM 3089]